MNAAGTGLGRYAVRRARLARLLRRRRVATLAVLVLVLTLASGVASQRGSAPTGGQAPAAAAPGQKEAAKPKPLPVGEVPDLRTRSSKTVRDANGRLTTTIFTEPLNYRDASGRWQPIDTRLSASHHGGYDWANTTNAFHTRFKNTLSTEYLRLDVAGSAYTLSMAAGAARASVSGSGVTYAGVRPGVDLRYEVSTSGVKETLALADAAVPTRYRFSLATPVDATAARLRDGSVEVRRPGSAQPVMVLPAPTLTDSPTGGMTAAAPVRGAATLGVAQVRPGLFSLDLSVDASWLRSPQRQFPVLLDPTFFIQPDAKDATFFPNCPTCAGAAWTDLYMGTSSTDRYRGAMQFTLAPVPAGGRLDSAELGVIVGAYIVGNGTTHRIDTHRITSTWTPTSAMPSIDSTILASATATPYAPAVLKFDVSATVKSWYAGTLANNGFMLQRSDETLGKGGVASAARSSTQPTEEKPYLAITYTTDAPTLYQPDTVHSNGADLKWTKYTGALSGAPFVKYEVHRSKTPNFTPSSTTLLMSTTDISTTTYRDTTGSPGGVFYYKVLANTSASQEVSVTLPADGQAVKYLQPDPDAGKDTKLFYQYFSSGDIVCGTYGTESWMRVGSDDGSTTLWRSLIAFDLKDIPPGSSITSATMSLWKIASNAAATVNAYRVTRDWVEGTYGCFNGATWYTAANGINWTTNGGDYDSTLVSSRTVAAGEAAGWHDFTITSAAQQWVSGTQPNLGLLLRVADESRTVKNDIDYTASDASASPGDLAHRPKLAVTYADGSHAVKPTVSIVSPAAGATVRGTTGVTAAASDDRRVDKVEFYRDGGATPIATVTAAPWTFNWSTTGLANGAHTLSAKAYDDAGNSTTSATVSVQVANYTAPTTSITSPANNATGLKGTVSVTTSETVASGLSVSKVELYADGALYGTSTTSPYTFAWNTLDAALPAYDRSTHTLATKVYDSSGQVVTSPTVTVTPGNTTGTKYLADFTSTAVPQAMTFVPGGPQLVYPVDVTVTNKSTVAWSGTTTFLRYRWYSPNPADPVIESGNIAALGLAAGVASAPVRVNVTPPTLPDGVDAAQYRLRFDVFDTATSPATTFAGKGNNPSENPVVVNKALSTKLGIEKYYSYVTTPVGAGMTNVVNVANGNSMLTLTPLSNPGRGLHTVARLTYNSLEEKSESPVGTNFSLSISSLIRFGNPLDIHPNNADTIAGRSNKFITFVDGDGSQHRFDGVTGADGITYWTEPPGVHLYLRSLTTDTTNPRYWALTRPDRVTFYFNSDGYPTFVTDRNGNTISFTLSPVAPGDDPGGPKFHVTAVTDAAGQGFTPAPNRSFNITYFTKATARKPQIRGKISRITDHLNHAIDFAYYDDGNLLSITERGGSNADGTALADRRWVFTYTTSDGSGPAIPLPANRVNPDPKTPNESSLIYSVRDPLGHETLFAYNGPGTAQDRWKLASVTDRAGNATTFGYDFTNRITTVAAPTPAGQTARTTRYSYDSDGKPVSITDPLNHVTSLEWNSDFAVTKITEPNLKTRRFGYNDNGYLTDVYDQLDNHTILTYQNVAADGNDTATHWRVGRTIPHLSQLATKQDPVEVAAGSSTKWTFGYDTAGNLTTVTEPLYLSNPARNTYNADGTVATSADFAGNVTTFSSYDDNGLPRTIIDPTDNPAAPTHPTKMQFDSGGRLLWVQDPGHAGYSSTDVRARTSFYYDSFDRLGRQSTPKSTSRELGQLIWGDTFYDANDNTVRVIAPHYGTQDSSTGDITTASYDVMDRQTLVTGPDTSADSAGERTRYDHDVAGRVTTVTLPLGMKNGTPNNTLTVNYSYDALDQVIRQTRYHQKPDGTIETLTQYACFDGVGNLVSTTAPKAALPSVACPADHTTPYTTVYGYDDAHRLTSISDPDNHTTRYGYDANGNRTSVTDAAQNQTVLRYDALNRLTRTDEPFITGATPRSVVTSFEYDANGNRTRIISPRGYDASPDKTTFTSYVTKFNYDQLNRLTRVDLPTDTSYPTAYYIHRGYDLNSNLTVTTFPDTHPNLVDVPASAKTLLEYFDPGWIAASNDPANPKVHFDYNARGQQTVRTPETRTGGLDAGKQIQWAYFPDGLLHERTDQEGQRVSYTYDADNQLLSSHDASGLTAPAETAVDTVNAYDDLDRLIRSDTKKQTDTNWTFSTAAYDANDNRTDTEQNGKETTPGGTVTTAGRRQHTDYDQADWITMQFDYGLSASASDDQRITSAFNPVGRQTLRRIEQNNGSGVWNPKQATTWDYFANGSLKTLTTTNASGTMVESHVVDYLDPAGVYVNGNRTKDTFTLRPSTGQSSPCYPGTCTASYTYDPRDRLVGNNDGHGHTTAYTLDGAGNILTEAVNGTTAKTYTYAGGQLQQIASGGTTNKYWYDDAGRLSCVTTAAGSSADCAPPLTPSSNLLADYTYDYLDRLATYRAFSTGTQTDKAEYTHDALDRVVSQTELHPGFNNDARTTTFAYLGLTNEQTRETQTNSTGTLAVKDYSYDPEGRRLSMTNTPYSGGIAQPATTYTYGYDTHGSASGLLDPSGNTKASYGYRPYGQPDTDLSKGDTDAVRPFNPFRYGAKRYDTGSATYDMGARRFGPDTSRFLNQDLFYGALDNLGLTTDPLTANRYALAAGNPISYKEWDGHMIIGDGGGGAGTTSGGTSQCYEAIACMSGTSSANATESRQSQTAGSQPVCGRNYVCADPGRGASPPTTQPSSPVRGLPVPIDRTKQIPPDILEKLKKTLKDNPGAHYATWETSRNLPVPITISLYLPANTARAVLGTWLSDEGSAAPLAPNCTMTIVGSEVGCAAPLQSSRSKRPAPASPVPGPWRQIRLNTYVEGFTLTATGKTYTFVGGSLNESHEPSTTTKFGHITFPDPTPSQEKISAFPEGWSVDVSRSGAGWVSGTSTNVPGLETSIEAGITSDTGASLSVTFGWEIG
jgi:RHS repeat-associated protein